MLGSKQEQFFGQSQKLVIQHSGAPGLAGSSGISSMVWDGFLLVTPTEPTGTKQLTSAKRTDNSINVL
jgi:hypothetical protein